MIHYYGGHHGPITKVDVGIFIAMNIFWALGWILSVVRWFIKIKKYDTLRNRFTLLDYRYDVMIFAMIDGVMGLFWVGVIFGVIGKFISMFL